jgi:hypothetical protein
MLRELRKNIMLKHIYIETSIPSLYYDIRTDAETVARNCRDYRSLY